VVNRAPDAARVDLDGWELGVVKPGQRVRFRRLRPGVRTVRATVGTLDQRAELTLRGGGTAEYVVMPADASTALDVPAEFGRIRLVNRAGRDLEVRVGEQSERTLMSGDTRILLDQPVGSHEIIVRLPGSSYRRTLRAAVTAGDEVTLEVTLETGQLRLTNRTGTAVRLFVDGLPRRTIDNEVQVDIDDLVVGVHKLRAVAVDSAREFLRTVNVTRDRELVWDLTASEGHLSVTNNTGEALAFAIDGTDRGTLAVGKELVWKDVSIGLRRVAATGQSSGYRWTADIPVTPGQRARWVLRNDVMTARVTNRLAETVELRVRGRRIRQLEPGASAFLDELRGPRPRLTAFATVSKRILEPTGEWSPARSLLWEIDDPAGQLRVVNSTDEAVIVYADQSPLGIVAAKQTLVFTQVPPGERLLEARLTGGGVIHDRVGVSADATAVWNVKARAGTLRVFNGTTEALTAPPNLTKQAKSVPPGAEFAFTVGTGSRRFHFIGARSGLSYHKELTVHSDESVDWHVEALMGVLYVFNRTAHDQLVRVDNGELLVVKAGKDVQHPIGAGVHRLVAVSNETGTAREITVVVRHGSVHTWQIRPKLGYVRVINKSHEVLALRVDGGILGDVEAHSARTWGPWPTGAYELLAQGQWSHALYEVTVTLTAGGVEAWEVLPARGVVHAVNSRTESVRLLIDRKEVATIPAGGEASHDVPIGPHLVELIGVDSLATFRFAARVRPDRAYTARAPEGPAALEIVNQTDSNLAVRVGDIGLGNAPAGVTVRLPLASLGDLTFYAENPEKGRVYHRRVVVSGDRIVRWIIRP